MAQALQAESEKARCMKPVGQVSDHTHHPADLSACWANSTLQIQIPYNSFR